jgi:hypothetical protein
MQHLCFHISGFQPLLDQPPCGEVANGLYERGMPDIIEGFANSIPPSTTHSMTIQRS